MSKIIWEILTIFWYGVTGTLGANGKAIWAMLPSIFEVRKVLGYFTPEGVIAFYVEVPTIVIALLCYGIKRMFNLRSA